MQTYLDNTQLHFAGQQGETSIYRLEGGNLSGHYYVISNPGTRNLLASPEVVGYDSYLAMLAPTTDMLSFLKGSMSFCSGVHILNILRGGLNYPLEESCYRNQIMVSDMDFISCERVIESNRITGLDIRYSKLSTPHDSTLMIGDIICSGETLVRCMKYVINEYKRKGGAFKRLVFFTVGGTRAIELLEELSAEFKAMCPQFEGITCIFYEGIFCAYQDKGISGISWPDIDFFWNGGVISPNFRSYVLKDDDALLEKCIIYDGGARRYNIPEHIHEVTEYWEDILRVCSNFPFRAFLEEKLGYSILTGYDEWLASNHYTDIDPSVSRELFELEQQFIKKNENASLGVIARRRLTEFREAMNIYTANN